MALSCRIITNTLLCVLPLSVQAQTNLSAVSDFFDDTPLILTASRMSKPLEESPASVSVITRQMIESSGVREIADLFRLVPGFVVGFHSGHAPAVTYHGQGREFARQIQVLIDGRSVFIPSFGGIPWSNLPLLMEDIERIEIIRGPNAVTYGANAFLATINIITRHAAEDIGVRYSITSSDNAHPDIKDAYLRIASHHQDLDWRISLGALNDEGFATIKDSKEIAKLNFRLDLQSDNNQLWTVHVGTSDSTAGRGFPLSTSNTTDIEREEEARNSYINILWEGVWDLGSSSVRLTHTRQKVTDHYDPGPIDFNGFPGVTTFIDFDRISDRTDLEFVQTHELGKQTRLVYGGSLRKDKVKSLFLLNDESFHDVDTNRLFSSLEWRFNKNWLLDIGLMVEDSNLTSVESSPRVSLIHKLSPVHTLRFVASRAKRNPILVEHDGETEFIANIPPMVVVPTLLGNDQIEPEDIVAYEIGLHSKFKSLMLTSDIKLFSYEISDHIINTTIPVDTGIPLGVIDVTTFTNSGKTKVNGIEVAVDYSPIKSIEIHAGFSLLDVETNLDLSRDSIPENIAFLSAQYRINSKHEISASYYYLDNLSWVDSSSDTPISKRLDLRYAYHLDNETRIELIGQNLINDLEDYEPENVHDQVVYLRLSSGF